MTTNDRQQTAAVERIRQLINGAATPPPIARLLGFAVTHAEPGTVTIAFSAEDRHHNPMGTLHGGVLCDIADAAMGMSYATMLEEDETFTTLELKINFLRPVRHGTLRAVGRVVSVGRTVGLVECDVVDERDRLMARATSTCMTLRGQQAEGRRTAMAVQDS